MADQGFCLEVSGPFACFTRPEMKVERVSYDVITPSAARAIFEAVLWKPAIVWCITRIEVCAPIRWISVRRNEVGAVVPMGSVKAAMNAGRGDLGMYVEDERQQRAGLFLRDVRYRLHARFDRVEAGDRPSRFPRLVDPDEGAGERGGAHATEPDAKYAAMFERRARKGQCFHQPYLGTREFACRFRLIDPADEPFAIPDTLRGERDLGWMLFDIAYGAPPHAEPSPLFFRACLRDGVLEVPPRQSEQVRG